MILKFKKISANDKYHFYTFSSSLGYEIEFKIDNVSKEIIISKANEKLTESQNLEFKYKISEHIIKNNFPDTKMLAYG